MTNPKREGGENIVGKKSPKKRPAAGRRGTQKNLLEDRREIAGEKKFRNRNITVNNKGKRPFYCHLGNVRLKSQMGRKKDKRGRKSSRSRKQRGVNLATFCGGIYLELERGLQKRVKSDGGS